MTMPIDLYLVRHGESEHNEANRASYQRNDESMRTPAFIQRPTALVRLTEKGVVQARAAGQWLQTAAALLKESDRYYSSSYVRAMETAAHLNLPHAKWLLLNRLRERSMGKWEHLSPIERRKLRAQQPVKTFEQDAYNWRAPNGESFADVEERLQRFLDTLHRECSEKRVVVVCHGEAMLTFRVMLERMNREHFAQIYGNSEHHTHNGMIIHYTRLSPYTGEIAKHQNWMRMIVPWNLALTSTEWRSIERPSYTNEDLLRLVTQHKPILQAS